VAAALKGPSAYGVLLPWLTILSLGVIAPAFFLSNTPGRMSSGVALLLAIVIWSTLRLVYSGFNGKRRLTLMCFYVFVYVFLGVQPLMSVWSGTFPYDERIADDLVISTIALIIVGMVSFEAAYHVSKRDRRRDGESGVEVRLIRPQPIWLSALWLGIVVAVAMVIAAVFRYGPGLYLGVRGGGLTFNPAQGAELSQTQWLIVVPGLRALLATLLFISIYLWKGRRSYAWPRYKVRRLGFTLVFLALINLIVSNPLNTARLWSGAVLVTAVFLSIRWKGPRSYLAWSLAACLGLLVVFAGVDPRRMIAQPLLRGEPVTLGSTATVIKESVQNLQGDSNFDAFQMIALTKRYADNTGYSFGHQVLLPLFFWVPRSIWPSKPIGTSDVVAESLGFSSTNVASPLWAEGYANLGILGVILFLGIFGRFARSSDDFLIRTTATTGPMLPTIASAFFAANTFILLRGDLATGTMYLQMIIGLTVMIQVLIKRHNPTRVPPQVSPVAHLPLVQR
jgi:hypothetical protein